MIFVLQIEAMQRKYLGRRGTAGGQADGEKEKSPSVVIQLWQLLLWCCSMELMMVILMLSLGAIILLIYVQA